VEFGVSTEPTSSSQEEEKRRSERTKALRELRVTLKDYRELAKKVARDRSLANAAKADMRRLFKQLAMFVSRIRTLEPEFGAQLIERARATKGKDEEADVRQGAQDPDDVDECTKSALADLVNQLLQPGGLVPRSRSKRVSASASGKVMVLPDEVVAVWAPLLAYMRETYGRIFGQILAEELVDVAFRRPALPDDDDTDAEQDASADDPSWQGWKAAAMSYASYGKTAEAWLRYLITTTPVASGAATSNAQAPVGPLVSDVEVAELCLPLQLPASTGLLDLIAERNHELGARIAPLIAVLRVSAFVTTTELDANPGQGDFTSELDVMQTRLDGMQTLFAVDERVADVSMDDTRQTSTNHVNGSAASAMPQGWSAAPSSWEPTPFGCLNGRIPNLVLEI
jgi:ribosomal biogenesis protein LAS1